MLISRLKSAARTLKTVRYVSRHPTVSFFSLSLILINILPPPSALAGAPSIDKRGNYVECHIFVPFGGVGKPMRNDRVFVVVSPDGRVHEPPIIQ